MAIYQAPSGGMATQAPRPRRTRCALGSPDGHRHWSRVYSSRFWYEEPITIKECRACVWSLRHDAANVSLHNHQK
eukprot:794629-Heterocapsa_arctica.AAC.1